MRNLRNDVVRPPSWVERFVARNAGPPTFREFEEILSVVRGVSFVDIALVASADGFMLAGPVGDTSDELAGFVGRVSQILQTFNQPVKQILFWYDNKVLDYRPLSAWTDSAILVSQAVSNPPQPLAMAAAVEHCRVRGGDVELQRVSTPSTTNLEIGEGTGVLEELAESRHLAGVSSLALVAGAALVALHSKNGPSLPDHERLAHLADSLSTCMRYSLANRLTRMELYSADMIVTHHAMTMERSLLAFDPEVALDMRHAVRIEGRLRTNRRAEAA